MLLDVVFVLLGVDIEKDVLGSGHVVVVWSDSVVLAGSSDATVKLVLESRLNRCSEL